jgi:short subunit dehydrogenase-like uncharacterized protein
MTSRIVLFGATGYTGRLTAEALVARGAKPVLAGRNRDAVAALAARLGGLDVAVADVASPESVHRLVGAGDVLVTTVGPYGEYGTPAVEAAIAAGATYLDCTGEGAFIRRMFEEWGPRAAERGAALLPAMGYDFVPGNLAGALALEKAGTDAVRVDVAYFATGRNRPSGGTFATLVSSVTNTMYTFRDGRVVDAPSGQSVRSFPVGGRQQPALSFSTSEHFALPAWAPQLREVNGYLGWFGPMTKPLGILSSLTSKAARLPAVDAAIKGLLRAVPHPKPGEGPDAAARARSGSHIVAMAYDARGTMLSEIHLTGVNGYDFTARMLAWGAVTAATAGVREVGALGPVTAYGLDELTQGVDEAGLHVE